MSEIRKKVWVEPKYSATKEREAAKVVLDIRSVGINNFGRIADAYESFVDLTGEIPDEVLMNENQYYWYIEELRQMAINLGLFITRIPKPRFRGIPVVMGDKK